MKKQNVQLNGTFILYLRVALNYRRLPIPDKIQKARMIEGKMTGNPNFPDPKPSLDVLKEAIDKLEVTYEDAMDGGKTKKQKMYAAEQQLQWHLTTLAAYVTYKCKGNPNVLLSSGMDAKKKPSLTGLLDAPENMRGIMGKQAGTITFRWKRNAKAVGYQFYYSDDLNGPWKSTTLSRSSITLKVDETNKTYYAKVTAFNYAGHSAYSNIGMAKAM